MSGLIDSALSALNMENKLLLAAAPAIAVGTLSIGSRVAMGAMALGCKGASSVVSYIDGDLSEAINDTAEELLSLAKRSFTLELQVGLGLTALTVAGIAISEFLFTQPEVTRLDKVTDFLGLTTPQYSNLEHITNFIGLTAPITRTDQVIAAASWTNEKIWNAYEYVPSAGTVREAIIELDRLVTQLFVAVLIKAPLAITKYSVMGIAFAVKFTVITGLKALILPLRVVFFLADKVNALYQSLPTAENVAIVTTAIVTWPFATALAIVTTPVYYAYHIVTWPLFTAFNIAAWPFIQAKNVAFAIYDFVQNYIVWPVVAVRNMISDPIGTLGYAYEGLREIVEKIKSVVTFLELDDSISQIVSWPFNKIYDIGAYVLGTIFYPVVVARNIAVFIKDCFFWPVVAGTEAVFNPVETVRYIMVDGIGGSLMAIVETIRSLSTAISKLEFA